MSGSVPRPYGWVEFVGRNLTEPILFLKVKTTKQISKLKNESTKYNICHRMCMAV